MWPLISLTPVETLGEEDILVLFYILYNFKYNETETRYFPLMLSVLTGRREVQGTCSQGSPTWGIHRPVLF